MELSLDKCKIIWYYDIRKGENMKNFNRTQSLEEAIETANEIDLSWFEWYLRFDKYKINGENRWVIQQNTNLTN